jgi:hypothetical protein
MSGHLTFEPDAMRSAAGAIDAARSAVDADLSRAASSALPPMPPPVAAAVRHELEVVQGRARAASRELEGVPVELRFRAMLAELADAGDPGASPGAPMPWGAISALALGGVSDGLSRFAKYWNQWTHVGGHWRTLANGTRTWVGAHWRNLGHDIAGHADDVAKLRAAGRVFKVLSVVPDAIDVAQSFHAPADQRTVAVGESSGKLAGGLAGGWAGAEGGAMLGATIGSVVPGAGTVAGGVAGAVIGGAVGALAGSEIGKRAGGAVAKPVVSGAKKVGEVAGKAAGEAKKALSSLNPF